VDAGRLAELSPRPACSDAERRAAVWAHDDLRARGREARVETHWIRPQLALALALGCALSALGGLVAIGAPEAGLAIAAIGALSLLIDVAGASGCPPRGPRCRTSAPARCRAATRSGAPLPRPPG